ncbi:Ig-like domain repeat protein [Methylomonas sp. AM2-LC]|uniref:Ig-like domain repeat protein n=1 Tax=Methylomonas sp. AM2-LC TaxID=3153301 RepID=UPI003266B7CA
MNSIKYLSNNTALLRYVVLVVLTLQTGSIFAQDSDALDKIQPHTRIVKHIDETDRITLKGNRVSQLDNSVDTGRIDDNLRLNRMILNLKSSPAQQAALDAFTQAQQTPGSPDYHHWLTPAEFASHFGVAEQDISAIKNFLTSRGFQIDEVAAGGRSIQFSGTSAQVRNAFHTEMHQYIWQGEQHIANASNPQIPAALANVVDGLVNLHDFRSHARKQQAQTNAATPLAKPISANQTQQSEILPVSEIVIGTTNYLTPADYGVIYDVNPLYTSAINGSGVKIAVLGRSNILNSDITSFQSFSGLTANPPQTIITNTDPGIVSGDQTESTLDVEWAGGIAPGATVIFITSSSTVIGDGIAYSASYAVNSNVGDIISLSYGACEQYMAQAETNAWSNLWQQAQSQGQTVLVSSGDSGAAGCDASNSSTAVSSTGVNGLCSSQFSTCVGGTEFKDTSNPSSYWLTSNRSGSTANALSYIPESVWNESASVSGGSGLYASGGGKSIYFSKPAWQVSPGVPADGQRDVPDISLAAAKHDGYIINLNGNQWSVGGTSAATPSFAGILALLEQYNGGRQGNINANLYGLYQLQAKSGNKYFHPTLSGNNSVPGQAGFSATGAGYNLATGLGSVDANVLVKQWHNVNPVSSSVALTSSASNFVSGNPITVTATVSGAYPTGSVQFKNNGVALGTPITINNNVASLTTSALTTPGLTPITAVYSGDGNNLSSSSAALNETVMAIATITVTVSAPTITAGQNITLTATVTGDTPTGTVQFYSNAVKLGSPVSLVNGVAVLTTNALTTTGLDNITATYSGDSLNTGNTSIAVSETVLAAKAQSVPALAVWQEILLGLLLFTTLLRVQRVRAG